MRPRDIHRFDVVVLFLDDIGEVGRVDNEWPYIAFGYKRRHDIRRFRALLHNHDDNGWVVALDSERKHKPNGDTLPHDKRM